METSVLIVGAGPTGLMLALELSALQIPFRIIDANVASKPTFQSRALVILPRSLELLARHDLADRFLAAGKIYNEIITFLKRRPLSKMNFLGIFMGDAMFQRPVAVRQPLTEKILEERLLQYGGMIERGISAEKIVTDADGEGVSVWVRHRTPASSDPEKFEEKEELIKCKYVVGCDGMKSKVRSSAGIKFEGTSRSEEYMLIDATVEWDHESSAYFFIDRGYVAFFPLDSKSSYRVVCRRPLPARTGFFSIFSRISTNKCVQEPQISDFNESITALVPGTTRIHSPTWFSTFRINSRLASSYNVGRLFIAGDAAHVHSPVGGMGMNSGMQDSVNLAWKLARVLRSNAPMSLLDSYEIERRKVAGVTVQSTSWMFDIMTTTNLLKVWIRNFFWSWILPYFGDPKDADRRIRRSSQLSIRYRNSPIVDTAAGWKGRLRGGDRAPDGWVVNSKGEKVTLHGLCKKPTDYLILFSSNNQSFEFDMENDNIAQLKSSCPDLVVLKVYNKDVQYEVSKDRYSDPEGKIHGLYQFDRPGYVLIRPDGYISHIGHLTSTEQLMGWARTYLQYKNDID